MNTLPMEVQQWLDIFRTDATDRQKYESAVILDEYITAHPGALDHRLAHEDWKAVLQGLVRAGMGLPRIRVKAL